jgi:pyrroline-5-carboxylate reductase
MVAESTDHPAQLRQRVTSPAGTTAAGLAALEQGNFRATVLAAVRAATARAKELASDG